MIKALFVVWCFCWLIVSCLLWILLFLILLSMSSSAVHMLELSVVYSFLQEQIDTVTVEGVEIAAEENWIEIKTEEGYVQLVGRVKSEQEVSVLCYTN
jgi:hypothetical protein